MSRRNCNKCVSCDETEMLPLETNAECSTTYEENKDGLLSDDEVLNIAKASSSNYFLVFERNKDIIYFIQDFTLPGVTNRTVSIPRPFADSTYKVSGVANDYDDITFNFLVDEKFTKYFNMLKWMRQNERMDNIRDMHSRASLFILNNQKKPIIEVRFIDIFPTSLSSITFQNQTDELIVANCTMASYHYEVWYIDAEDAKKYSVGYDWGTGMENPPYHPYKLKYYNIVGPK